MRQKDVIKTNSTSSSTAAVRSVMLQHAKSRGPRTKGRLFQRLEDGSLKSADKETVDASIHTESTHSVCTDDKSDCIPNIGKESKKSARVKNPTKVVPKRLVPGGDCPTTILSAREPAHNETKVSHNNGQTFGKHVSNRPWGGKPYSTKKAHPPSRRPRKQQVAAARTD